MARNINIEISGAVHRMRRNGHIVENYFWDMLKIISRRSQSRELIFDERYREIETKVNQLFRVTRTVKVLIEKQLLLYNVYNNQNIKEDNAMMDVDGACFKMTIFFNPNDILQIKAKMNSHKIMKTVSVEFIKSPA